MSKKSYYRALSTYNGGKVRAIHPMTVIVTATPNASITAPRPGCIAIDKTGAAVYRCTTPPTTWVATTAV